MFYIMNLNDLGSVLNKARLDAKLSKRKLADLSGVSRQYIAAIETGKRKGKTSADLLVKLANALNMSPKPFLEAIGLTYQEPDLPKANRTPHPLAIPIYTEFPFHAGSPTMPAEYIYRTESKNAPKNIEGYIVHGACLIPTIQDKDIIIVDREGQIDNGDIVACLMNGERHIAKLRRVADEFWLENNNGKYLYKDCQVVAPVIEVIRRLK